nr:SrfA family protein [uncultured Desulfovibrio sp.]
MSIRIAVSMRGPMRALASQGILATDCHAQLKAILLQKLGPEHAALLAEPQHDAEGSSVDWYAEGQGPAIALKDLPEEDANTLRARATSLANDIAALSGTLTSDAQARQALSGQLLRLALQHPSDGDIWSVNGQPVLVNWGFAPGSAGALPQDLTRLGAALPPPPVPPVPAQAAGAGCLPWLLPLLLLLLLLWLLGAALGLFPSPLPAGCLPVDRKNLVAEEQRTAALDDELALLWSQLLERAALCKPVKPAPVQEEKEEPVAPLPEPEIVEPFLGETPPAPKPVPQPKPVEPPRQPEKPKKKNEDLTIPQDAAKKNDLSFLEGCWTSETGLYSHPSNEPIVAEYCFDKKGKGRRFVRERNGQVCSGSANARFQGNRLNFESDQARCPRGGTYVPQKVECTGSENTTQCKGRELGAGNNKWDARFRRK